ncbi:MAG: glycosyltransferase family 8 protein [Acinetobacter sp.]|nr:glycosyltransferase family 8 protein [Acinetobacter sp.]
MLHQPLTIVLAADYAYAEQVQTTIKSICYHQANVRFYLMNNDYPSEWFAILNQQLHQINCHIESVRILHKELKAFYTLPHIKSESTYYRYFIGERIPEEKVLYLDCDLVVNGDLTPLWQTDVSNYAVAAVKDPLAITLHKLHQFNAGVLLINNRYWKQHKVAEKALYYTSELSKVDDVKEQINDQEILNVLFEKKWLKLNRGYNYQIGVDVYFKAIKRLDLLEDLGDQVPLIVHYVTEAKPWRFIDATRFRELYWRYYTLSWQDIIQRYRMV